RMNYAFALANGGEFDRAINLARIVAFDPHDGGGGEALLDQLEAMRDRDAEKNISAEKSDDAAAD
ncbi:hypothetical protein, partial [Bacillus sp. SIMBA_005]|uniref:hypothetical protein n=1 Tax=Bacillus sp. SIMBA_005 TaxID=3085754 RepID=UPI0039799CB4